MKIFHSPKQLMTWRAQLPPTKKIGFVPTMGALHSGHTSLIQRARKSNDLTVVSIFVNPIQFGPKEDFNRYPRPEKSDKDCLIAQKVDALFMPSPAAMYSPQFSTRVEVPSLNSVLCGDPKRRGPQHFNGVSTVVAKLFNIVRPHRAYFGMKDFQQLRVLEQMNNDLNFGITVVRCPTVREKDGLAKSSRNAYLSVEERQWAPRLYVALQHGRKLLTSNPFLKPHFVIKKVKSILLSIPDLKIDYVELVDAHSLTSQTSNDRPRLLAAAAYLGKTRLIDNVIIPPHA